jgi:alpha-tubulin suppressor-like RCC1 family protein
VSGVELLACGGTHTCVTKVDDSIWCWGGNASGQLGVGDQTARPVPAEVMGIFGDVYDLDAGGNHTCVSVESYLYCWGSNQHGQLGDGTTIDRVWPVEVSSIQDERIAAGDRHTCSSDYETVHCWGDNSDGQLGDGTTVSSSVPVMSSSYSGNMVTLGNAHSCQDADGEPSSWPVCWGRNADGQVGDGGTASVLSPVEVLAPAAP